MTPEELENTPCKHCTESGGWQLLMDELCCSNCLKPISETMNKSNWFERQPLWVKLLVCCVAGFVTGGVLVFFL